MAKPRSIETPDEQHAAVAAGQRMLELVTDPVVIEAFAALRSDYTAEWVAAKTTDAREAAWYKQRALDDLDAVFRAAVGTGQLAANKLKQSR